MMPRHPVDHLHTLTDLLRRGKITQQASEEAELGDLNRALVPNVEQFWLWP